MGSITAIVSLEHREATKLRKAGVRTTESLLKVAATRPGRRRLARETGLDEKDILSWADRADLMRVPGIGPEYADLLGEAGVDTIRALRRRNPGRLFDVISEANRRCLAGRRLPTPAMVDAWVEGAREIEPVVVH